MSRKRRRRRAPEPLPVPVVEDRPVDMARLRAKFSSMTHRGTPLFQHYVFAPVVVDARTPEEAAILSDLALSEETKKGPEN
jgi:hypothetical protein